MVLGDRQKDFLIRNAGCISVEFFSLSNQKVDDLSAGVKMKMGTTEIKSTLFVKETNPQVELREINYLHCLNALMGAFSGR